MTQSSTSSCEKRTSPRMWSMQTVSPGGTRKRITAFSPAATRRAECAGSSCAHRRS